MPLHGFFSIIRAVDHVTNVEQILDLIIISQITPESIQQQAVHAPNHFKPGDKYRSVNHERQQIIEHCIIMTQGHCGNISLSL